MDIVFALFDLLRLAVRAALRDIADQKLYRVDKSIRCQNIGPLVRGTIDPERIFTHWEDLLRVAGSLKLGWVTASLFIGKRQSYRRRNALTCALQEYGQTNRTIWSRSRKTDGSARRPPRSMRRGELEHQVGDAGRRGQRVRAHGDEHQVGNGGDAARAARSLFTAGTPWRNPS